MEGLLALAGSFDVVFAGIVVSWYVRLRRLHYRSLTGLCAECHQEMPCPTIRTLTGGIAK